ncbi:MAG: MmgE/PrpD family protein [Chloroflexi bacterium]|nr:MmgE/PrpD family protein [Chloroflexota bacterium]
MPTAAERLAEFAVNLRYEDLPEHVVADAKLRFMDTIGVCLLSSRMDFSQPVADMVREQGGRAEATVLGFGDRVPASQAVLVNGVLAHGSEYDDTDAGSGIHPSCTVVTTALAAAERVGAGGRATLAAAQAGYELAIRLGRAGINHYSSYHPTAIAGTFASVLVAGKLFGLDANQLANALGIAGSQAAGTWKFTEDGSWNKRLHGGWPGHCAITAALLAQRGFIGPHAIFEGERGIVNVYGGRNKSVEALTAGLGEDWVTPGTTYKVYPCCSLGQAAMDAARRLQREHRLGVDDLEQVECFIPPEASRITAEPREQKLNPQTTYQAFFSFPYCVAIALTDEVVTVDSYAAERLPDPSLKSLARRVVTTVDESLLVANGQPARVVITTRDGKRFQHQTALRGTPENPFLPPDVEAKFRQTAGRVLAGEQIEGVLTHLRDLEQLDDVRRLTGLCAPITAPAARA